MSTTKDTDGAIYRSNSFHVLANDYCVEVWDLHTGDVKEYRYGHGLGSSILTNIGQFAAHSDKAEEYTDEYLSQYFDGGQ
jgi:hypothetical protein